MTLLGIIFYLIAILTIAATVLAITAAAPVHSVIYLICSFFGTALLFYLLGAPLLAAFEVIIYAGAIMVLFLFVIMMLDLGHPDKAWRPHLREWWPALLLGGIVAGAVLTLATTTPANGPAGPTPDIKAFSQALFQKYGVAVEIISMQLLFAVVGALYLGRRRR